MHFNLELLSLLDYKSQIILKGIEKVTCDSTAQRDCCEHLSVYHT